MPASRKLRLVVVCGLVALFAAAGCRRGGDTDQDVDVTEPPPSPTPSVEAVADFQLVGRIDEAFAGQDPDVDLPDDLDTAGGLPTSPTAASPSPAGTPVGQNPPRGGILRIEIEDLSDGLTDACGIDADDVVEVFWTTSTFFEPASILDDFGDIEDDIEDRTAGVSGGILRTAGLGGFEPAGTPTPEAEATPEATGPAATTSPGAPTVQDGNCILVAEQIGFTITRLPTPRPAARGPTPPAPTAARTPTPRPATATPIETEEPTEPPATATPPTATPGPT